MDALFVDGAKVTLVSSLDLFRENSLVDIMEEEGGESGARVPNGDGKCPRKQ